MTLSSSLTVAAVLVAVAFVVVVACQEAVVREGTCREPQAVPFLAEADRT